MTQVTQTDKAVKANIKRMKKEYEEKKERVLRFIMSNQGETAYSISKNMDLPRSSLIKILNDLEADLQIKFVVIKENSREKKTVHTKTIDDFTHDRFNFESLKIPLVKRLIKNAQDKGFTITVDMPNGSMQLIQQDQDIEDFIETSS